MSQSSIDSYDAPQSQDKMDFKYMNPSVLQNPTIRGIPRMYDLMGSVGLNSIVGYQNQPDPIRGNQLNRFYDQYYNPYHQYRKNYPCTYKYGFVEPDPLQNSEQSFQMNPETQMYQQGPQLDNTRYDGYTNRENNFCSNCNFGIKNSAQHQSSGRFADQISNEGYSEAYPGDLNQMRKETNKNKEFNKQNKFTQIHITLDHPENPYVERGQIIPQEKKQVVVREYYPLKNSIGADSGLHKYEFDKQQLVCPVRSAERQFVNKVRQ